MCVRHQTQSQCNQIIFDEYIGNKAVEMRHDLDLTTFQIDLTPEAWSMQMPSAVIVMDNTNGEHRNAIYISDVPRD